MERENTALLEKLASRSLWEKEQSRHLLLSRFSQTQGVLTAADKARARGLWDELKGWKAGLQGPEATLLGESLFNASATMISAQSGLCSAENRLRLRAAAIRLLASQGPAAVIGTREVQRPDFGARFDPATREQAVAVAKNLTEQLMDLLDELLKQGTQDANPRVRLEAIRGLGHLQTSRAAELVLEAIVPGSARRPACSFRRLAGNVDQLRRSR
jgi:hypothetical protein